MRVRLRPAVPRGLTALVWIPETLITAAGGTPGWAGAQVMRLPEDATSMGGGWYAFGRHRSARKMVGDPAGTPPPREADTAPIYEPLPPGWFRGGMPSAGTGGAEQAGAWTPANWDSPADAGWRAAESAATPVRGQLTGAGLPQRIPRANIVPGSVGERAGERPAPSGDHPVPDGPRRSPDAARNRLAGLQRGTRRAENAAASRVREPAGG